MTTIMEIYVTMGLTTTMTVTLMPEATKVVEGAFLGTNVDLLPQIRGDEGRLAPPPAFSYILYLYWINNATFRASYLRHRCCNSRAHLTHATASATTTTYLRRHPRTSTTTAAERDGQTETDRDRETERGGVL